MRHKNNKTLVLVSVKVKGNVYNCSRVTLILSMMQINKNMLNNFGIVVKTKLDHTSKIPKTEMSSQMNTRHEI